MKLSLKNFRFYTENESAHVQAIQFITENHKAIEELLGLNESNNLIHFRWELNGGPPAKPSIVLGLTRGEHTLEDGDWLVCFNRNFYVAMPDENFKAMYERVPFDPCCPKCNSKRLTMMCNLWACAECGHSWDENIKEAQARAERDHDIVEHVYDTNQCRTSDSEISGS